MTHGGTSRPRQTRGSRYRCSSGLNGTGSAAARVGQPSSWATRAVQPRFPRAACCGSQVRNRLARQSGHGMKPAVSHGGGSGQSIPGGQFAST